MSFHTASSDEGGSPETLRAEEEERVLARAREASRRITERVRRVIVGTNAPHDRPEVSEGKPIPG